MKSVARELMLFTVLWADEC